MDLTIQLGSIVLLGLIGASTPGPILTSAFTEALHKGFVKSLRVIFYALLSEFIVAGFILFALFSVHIPKEVFYIISFIGAFVLLWIAKQIWAINSLHNKGKIFTFQKMFLLTLFNGSLWIFWVSVCVPQAYLLSQKIRGGQLFFLLAFESGWLSATVVLTFLFSRFRPMLMKEGVMSKVFKVFALILLLFAVRLVVTSIFFFLGK